jgi:hypothetical protein
MSVSAAKNETVAIRNSRPTMAAVLLEELTVVLPGVSAATAP